MSDVDRYQYGYDQNSNRLFKANTVGTPMVSGGLDEYYTYDNLNRLTVMQRGTLNTGRTGIAGTPVREMDYTLDPTGNWSAYVTKTNGTTDLSQTRTANKVNEITAIGGTPGWFTPPVYDAAGNMKSFPEPASPTTNLTATYDAWNRLRFVSNSSGGIISSSLYDGFGRRVYKYSNAISEVRNYYYTAAWQDIEERVNSAATMDQQYVWGVRYIDELVCRDDATPERLYATQDANFNLTSISNTSGGVVERYLFDPYGTRTIMNGSWGTISASGYNWVIGHQGLVIDPEDDLVYCRSRHLHTIVGTWLHRDQTGYRDGVNLYEYVQDNPISFVDPFGLAACCCCCVDDLKINNIASFDHITQAGHFFDVVATLSYKRSDTTGSCTLKWEETSNIPTLTGQNPNEPIDVFKSDPTNSVFDPWAERKMPCPGNESITITDQPSLTKRAGRNAFRRLQIKVTIESAPGCDCANESLIDGIEQDLRMVNGKIDWDASWLKTIGQLAVDNSWNYTR